MGEIRGQALKEGITIVVPTIGRPSLERTLVSFIGQMSDRDEAVIIHDGEHPETSTEIINRFGDRRLFFLNISHQGHVGHPARNTVLNSHVHTTHVWSIDDDDVAHPDALAAMRSHFDDPWTIFRMHYGAGHPASGLTLPNSNQIRWGNIGTPMIFARKSNARFGHHYAGDLDYAQALHSELGEPVWASETVAIIQPDAVPAA